MPRNKTADQAADKKTVKYVPLTLDGEEYSLIFDFNAIATAELVAKVNLLDALDLRDLTAGQFRGLLYAALLKGQPGIKLTEVGDLITLPHMPAISDAILAAWQASLAPADLENPPPPVPSPAE